jgi:hypothetical protein
VRILVERPDADLFRVGTSAVVVLHVSGSDRHAKVD